MTDLVRRIRWDRNNTGNIGKLLTREWIVTNGLGGYASGTVSGVATRRYHGLLIAALPTPLGRIVMFNHLSEQVQLTDGSIIDLSAEEQAENVLRFQNPTHLAEFRLEKGLPVWTYIFEDAVIEKRVMLPNLQNTVYINYKLISGKGPIRLELRPSFHFRPHEDAVNKNKDEHYQLNAKGDQYEITSTLNIPPIRMKLHNYKPALTIEGDSFREIFYRLEAERGYESRGILWNPGYFRGYLEPGKDVTLTASTENWEVINAMKPAEAFKAETERRRKLLDMAHPNARTGTAAELVLAADQFIISPSGRVEDTARARASGDEIRSVIAGYHWFTDWGRDTMISLEGLTLTTGRFREAGWIIRTFAQYIDRGLIPNMFPEGEKRGLYHTADATLWFFHAVKRYLDYTGDRATMRDILDKFVDVAEHHLRGTAFGIGVDHTDGLLKQGQEGYQLTWMDAKVDGWVVTPRRGKAVEINALWYNALKILANWLKEEGRGTEAEKYEEHAAKAKRSFNEKFWNREHEYLYDIVEGEEGNDDACRPNQIFAVALDYPVLNKECWVQVVNTVADKLLTPVGLRSLAPGHADYKKRYFGDLRTRDAAYHQGTVWGWLIGPFIDAWLKVHPRETERIKEFLKGFENHLDEACIGTISEIFDAEEPYIPRGCVAQAWSIAEVLRCHVKADYREKEELLLTEGKEESDEETAE